MKEKTMENKNVSGQLFSPKQAKYRVVEKLPDLSPEALNELLVFIDFWHFREQAIDQPDKAFVKSENVDDEKIEFAKSIKGKYRNCSTNSKIFVAMKRQEIELEERKFKKE